MHKINRQNGDNFLIIQFLVTMTIWGFSFWGHSKVYSNEMTQLVADNCDQ